MKPHILGLAALALSACRSQPSTARNAVDSVKVGAQLAPPDSARSDTTPWFFEHRELDLTNDGRPDTISLRAEGRASDSLTVTLRFYVDGVERWQDQWGSDYMLIDPPEFPEGEVSRAAYLRRELKSTLENVRVDPFDSTEYAQMADPLDSTILRRPPRQEVVVSFGYETTIALTWDPETRSFRRLWSCC